MVGGIFLFLLNFLILGICINAGCFFRRSAVFSLWSVAISNPHPSNPQNIVGVVQKGVNGKFKK